MQSAQCSSSGKRFITLHKRLRNRLRQRGMTLEVARPKVLAEVASLVAKARKANDFDVGNRQ
jgi:hypothetical protein